MDERLNDSVPAETIIKFLKLENKKLRRNLQALSIKIGQEVSYSQELEFELNKYKKELQADKETNAEARKEARKEILYNMLRDQISELNKDKKKLKIARDTLIKKVFDYEKLLKENNLL